MRFPRPRGVFLPALLLILPLLASGAAFNEQDSTQPRGAPLEDARNPSGQVLDPLVDGMRSPAYRAAAQEEAYADWAGSIMSNATRDPSFYATLAIANQDVIDLVNSLEGDPADPDSPLGAFLKLTKLDRDLARGPGGRLRPEDLIPMTGDLCLRCHSPTGWMEGHSEPPTAYSPHLKGQLWGAAFLKNPLDAQGKPRLADTKKESEAELDGVDCDFCHRATDTARRTSRFDGSTMSAGNGGFFVEREDPFEEEVEAEYDILAESDFCGTCHDVTNPLLKTATPVGGKVPDMLHPIERTYTEWYWSGYRGKKACLDCHEPMAFQGAQTWMIHPGLDLLWGKMDESWRQPPYEYDVPERAPLLLEASETNLAFMASEAATVEIVEPPTQARPGDPVRVQVKVTNSTGHKLPTGFAEGRQAWIHVRVTDAEGKVVYEDGKLDERGALVRTPETKVYEQVVMAGSPVKREDGSTCYEGYPFLDRDRDDCVDYDESHFHFVLMNYIKKDNRIPPKGFNKAAYEADGAFIVPADPKDTDYADGQNWDVTPYSFEVPAGAKGKLRVSAELLYQTFNREYVDFLASHDHEKTRAHGGRARDLPEGRYEQHPTWGQAMLQLWMDAGRGAPVSMGEAAVEITVEGSGPDSADGPSPAAGGGSS